MSAHPSVTPPRLTASSHAASSDGPSAAPPATAAASRAASTEMAWNDWPALPITPRALRRMKLARFLAPTHTQSSPACVELHARARARVRSCVRARVRACVHASARVRACVPQW